MKERILTAGAAANSIQLARAPAAVPFHSQPLIAVLIAICCGILADRFGPVPAPVWWGLAIVMLVAWWATRRGNLPRTAALCLLLACSAAAAAWHHCQWHLFAADEIGRFARDRSAPVCVEAIALDAPTRVPAPPLDPLRTMPRGDQTRVRVRLQRVRDASEWRGVSGRATMLVEGHLLAVHPGDRLQIFAQLKAPSAADNPGERDFAAHDRADRELCQLRAIYPDCVRVVRGDSGWGLYQGLREVRGRCDQLLWRYLSHERSGLAAAVLLGARERLERERMEAFFHTGTIHLLAISGLHVGIMACALLFIARRSLLPTPAVLLLVMGLTVAYAVLTDARAPVVRAAILVVFMCTAWLLKRGALPLHALAAAAIVVLLVRPADLFRTGAQLSFLAVAALAWFGPRWLAGPRHDALQKLVWRTRRWPTRAAWTVGGHVRRLLRVSLVIWMVTLPLVMYRFHLVAPIAIVMNVVLAIPIALALFSGFAVLLFGWLFPPLAMLSGWFCDLNLGVLEWSVQQAERLPGSHWWVAGPSCWWLVGWYAGLALLAGFPRIRPPRRWCWTLATAWVALPMAIGLWHERTDRGAAGELLQCTFLSVGHGTAVVVELPDGSNLLYDAGRMGEPESAVEAISAYLWSRNISHLEAVVLSHSDADHYNALPGLLKRFSVGVVYVSPLMFEVETAALAELRTAMARAGVPVRQLCLGDCLRTGRGAHIETLHPPARGVVGGDNANSIVLSVAYAGHRILLPGDLESPGLDDVLADEPLDCDVTMAPHHGSLHSDPVQFMTWCSPEWIVVSGGPNDGVRDAQAAFHQPGNQVLHTALDGAVTVAIDRHQVWVRCWHAAKFQQASQLRRVLAEKSEICRCGTTKGLIDTPAIR